MHRIYIYQRSLSHFKNQPSWRVSFAAVDIFLRSKYSSLRSFGLVPLLKLNSSSSLISSLAGEFCNSPNLHLILDPCCLPPSSGSRSPLPPRALRFLLFPVCVYWGWIWTLFLPFFDSLFYFFPSFSVGLAGWCACGARVIGSVRIFSSLLTLFGNYTMIPPPPSHLLSIDSSSSTAPLLLLKFLFIRSGCACELGITLTTASRLETSNLCFPSNFYLFCD